jgi:xylose isomerase
VEAFLGRKGERALFNSVELDKEDIEMNKKYMFAVEYKGKILASGQIIILGEKPKFSGKVDFNEEDTKKKE